MAIAIAQLGGIGVIHSNMPLGKQVEEVRRVKRAEAQMILNPITVSPEASIAEAMDLMTTYKISGLPVLEQPSQKVIGIITARDIRFFEDYAKPVTELMTKEVITVKNGIEMSAAKRLMHQHRIEKLVVVDEQGHCVGLITVKDLKKMEMFPHAARDIHGRLLVAAAVGTGKDAFDRAGAMADAGLDVIFIDAAHAHTRDSVGTVSRIRQQRSSEVQIVAGNVSTPDAARSLVDAGADAIKVGVGADGGVSSRSVSGIGMPSLTAVLKIAEECAMMNIPVIAGGGIMDSAALAKAIGAGASAAVIDQLFAGTDEAPGSIVHCGLPAYKVVNPTARPQHRPPFTSVVQDPYDFDGDPVDTSVPYRGAVAHVVQELIGGLKLAMAYTGSKDIPAMIENAEFVRTT
jgi:IMP dehydrogenase